MCSQEERERAEMVRLAWEQSHNIGRREQARVIAGLAERMSKRVARFVAAALPGRDEDGGGPLSYGTR